jgi:hypothetical protein
LCFTKYEVGASHGWFGVRAFIEAFASCVVPDFTAFQVRALVDPLVERIVLPRFDQGGVVPQSASNQVDESRAVGKVGIGFCKQLAYRLAARSEIKWDPADRLKPRRGACAGGRGDLFPHDSPSCTQAQPTWLGHETLDLG